MFTIIFFVILLLSAAFHEYMHAWAADQMGDRTARDLGRLTVNPIAHIDPFSTLLLPALLYIGSGGQFMFAAAKPVPFNPYNLKYPKYGPALVGLAGPFGNLLLALLFAVIVRSLPGLSAVSGLASLIVYTNVLLAIFNLVPIPPLDGHHLLLSVIPAQWEHVAVWLERYGIILFVIFLMYFSGVITPIINQVSYVLLGEQGFVVLAQTLRGMAF